MELDSKYLITKMRGKKRKLKTYKVWWEEKKWVFLKARDSKEALNKAIMGEYETEDSEMTYGPECIEVKE